MGNCEVIAVFRLLSELIEMLPKLLFSCLKSVFFIGVKCHSAHVILYGVHLVAALVKRLIRGTFQGRFEPKYLQNYLDEYVFRFNRRKSKYIGKKFMRIVQQVVKSTKIKCNQIKWDIDPISEFFSLELCR